MRRRVTGTGRQCPSARSRRAPDRAWSRARSGSGPLFVGGLLWSSLGHALVLGPLILVLAGRPMDIPSLEIFAAEAPAQMDQPPEKQTTPAEASPARPRSLSHPKISRRTPQLTSRAPMPAVAETRREVEPAASTSTQVPDVPASDMREEPVPPRADTGAAPMSLSTDHAESQPLPQAEPALTTSPTVPSDDAPATASVAGEVAVADAPAVVATPTSPVASAVPVETTPSVPTMPESKQNPGVARALTPEDTPSPAPARIEPLAPPA